MAGPLGPDANVRLPVVKTNGSELASHHEIKMIQMFAFFFKMVGSWNTFVCEGRTDFVDFLHKWWRVRTSQICNLILVGNNNIKGWKVAPFSNILFWPDIIVELPQTPHVLQI